VVGAPGLAVCLAELARLHPRICPRQVLGVRMALWTGQLLELDLPRHDKRLLALIETDGCFADGFSVASGCWLGRRTLRLVDHGKVAVTVTDTMTERSVRIWPQPLARDRALAYAPSADRWQAQLTGYQVMPTQELLCSRWVTLSVPSEAILGRPGVRVTCAACGEEVLNDRQVITASGPICRGCARERSEHEASTTAGRRAYPVVEHGVAVP
jgi:formylmethanofuran dehydrogenase subunit E